MADAALATWEASLLAWAQALKSFGKEVGESGVKAIGDRWTGASESLAESAAALEKQPDDRLAADGSGDGHVPGTPDPAPLERLMALGSACEGAARALGRAATAYLDPNVRAVAAMGMSRTFFGNLDSRAQAAERAAAAARAAARQAIAAAAAAGADLAPTTSSAEARLALDGLARRFGRRSAFATELYLSIIGCRRSPDAEALSRGAKDDALGSADSIERAAADTAAFAAFHPCQAMGYAAMPLEAGADSDEEADARPQSRRPAAGAGPRAREAARGPSQPAAAAGEPPGPPVSLALPQATLAVKYRLGRLISQREASRFGPLAPMTSGLNYNLVERLRTIATEPLARGAAGGPAAERPALVSGPLLVTADGGATTASLRGPAGRWAPFAGPRPRLLAYGAVAGVGIIEGLRAEAALGWGAAELRERYNAYTIAQEAARADQQLLDALVAGFGAAYDAAPPQTFRELREMCSDERPLEAPPLRPENDFVLAAVSRANAELADSRLQTMLLARGQSAPGQKAPFAAVEREARLSQVVYDIESARGLRRAFRGAFRFGDDFTAAPPAGRRAAAVRAFRRAAAVALQDPPFEYAPLSFKAYAACNLRPS